VDTKIEIRGISDGLLGIAPQEVVASGSTVIFNGETIAFTLSEDKRSFVFEVQLVDSAPIGGLGSLGSVGFGMVPGDQPSMQSQSTGPNSVKLTLTNFGRQPALGTTSRIPVAYFGTKQLYFIVAT